MVSVVQLFVLHQLMVTVPGAFGQGALIHAVVKLNGSRDNILNMISEQLEQNMQSQNIDGNANRQKRTDVENTPSTPSTSNTPTLSLAQVYAAALLLGGPISVHGNISADSSHAEKTTTITFTLHTNLINSNAKEEPRGLSLQSDVYEENHESDWHSDDWANGTEKGGILKAIVNFMEPYILTILNIIFHGIMTSVVTKIMDNANMTGDVRLA